uniref:Uncharacterized protein n=1 Tax=Oryza punctata TaxID=4537 RepID=A0A0E0LDF8_ORYPU
MRRSSVRLDPRWGEEGEVGGERGGEGRGEVRERWEEREETTINQLSPPPGHTLCTGERGLSYTYYGSVRKPMMSCQGSCNCKPRCWTCTLALVFLPIKPALLRCSLSSSSDLPCPLAAAATSSGSSRWL